MMFDSVKSDEQIESDLQASRLLEIFCDKYNYESVLILSSFVDEI